MAEPETRTNQDLPPAAALTPAAFIAVQEPGGPMKRAEIVQLADLIAADAVDGALETAINNLMIVGAIDILRAEQAPLLLDLAHPADTVAFVYADPDDAKNDFHIKLGAPGAGSWQPTTILHDAIAGVIQPYVDDVVAAEAAVNAFKDNLDENVFDYRPSKNFAEPAKRVSNEYISTGTGERLAAAGWSWSGMLPVTPGTEVAISSNAAMQGGVGFYATEASVLPVAGGLNTASGSITRILTVPAGAFFMGFNIADTEPAIPSQIQAEIGSAATAYEAWHPPVPIVRAEAVEQVPSEYEEDVPSRNLFDMTNLKAGFLSISTGEFIPFATWRTSNFIDISHPSITHVTVQGERSQTGISFFTSATNGAVVPGSYSSGAGTRSVAKPLGATHVIIDLYNAADPSFSRVQLETGVVPTEYVEFGTRVMVKKGFINPPVAGGTNAQAVLSQTGQSFINVKLGDRDLRLDLAPFLTTTHGRSGLFDVFGEAVDGKLIRGAGDDQGPYRINNWQTGGNHGYAKSTCPVPAHGKALADVGSVYSDGVNQHVIVDIPANGQIALTRRGASNAVLANGATLTHVSDGTNTAAFNAGVLVAGAAATQLYPVHNNRKYSISVNGSPVGDHDASYDIASDITFHQSYDVLEKASLVEWLITQAGTPTDILNYQGNVEYSVSMNYSFDADGGCTVPSDFVARQAIPVFNDIIGVQSGPFLAGVDGPVKFYIPNSLPFIQGGTPYDFSSPFDMTAFAPAAQIDITPARCEAVGQLCDRIVMLNDSVGMATGLLPVLDADPAVRRTNVTENAVIISQGKKAYVNVVDNAIGALAAGNSYSWIGYKVYFLRSPDRTASYVVRSVRGDFLFCDWHDTDLFDRVPLPNYLHGKSFTQIAARGITPLCDAVTNNLPCDVATSGDYGFLVLRFDR